ncbi:MAG TPA: SurA N-terminal domain-containing protein [Salinivirgaceae bacterium]|nr:SurA N-terminal domain-containing protein [Salinivirgaceae bacterium]HQA76189.1 SurA N-terminal domain-containing protein [Salinivirgaceae bacterium]
MPALEKIRNRSGLLIAVVGVALLAFILGDFFSSRNAYRGQPDIAEINGEKIYYVEYQQRVDETVENMKQHSGQTSLDDRTYAQIQDQVWDQLVNKLIMSNELEKLGLTVSSEELLDMVKGNNIHPEVQSIPIFQNPETGTFDPSRVVLFLQNLDADNTGRSRQAWMSFEEFLLQQRENDKYYSVINKGIYVTDLQARYASIEKSAKVDLKAVYVPYTSINDSLVTVTDKELKDYYNAHKEQYKQDLSIDLEYVLYPIEATDTDIEAIIKELKDIQEEFALVQDNQNYVSANSDGSYDGKFYRKNEYSNTFIDSVMFSLQVGEIYGPYREDNKYKLTKLAAKEMQPDSIQIAEVILVPKKQEDVEAMRSQADSIVDLINNGAKISDFANFNENQESIKPEWVNTESIPYGQSLLAVKTGKAVVEILPEGFHVIQVVARGKEELKIQLATLERTISASDNTRTLLYQKANNFASTIRTASDFNAKAEDFGLVKRVAGMLSENSREIRGLDNARTLIREAFFATEGTLVTYRNNNSPIFEIGDNYVIALLKKRNEKGYKPIDDIKPTIENNVKKQKKAKTIIANFESALKEAGSDIEQLAKEMEAEIKEVNSLTFSAYNVPGGVGIEPKINGIALMMDKGQLSEPIEGNNGVYVISVVEKHELTDDEMSLDVEKYNIRRILQSRTSSEISQILKDVAKIEDHRLLFQ